MAASLNKVQIIGHLGRDPESRSFQNGGKVVNINVATSETWKDKQGERQERTQWHQVAIFNEGLAGVAEKYLRKGSKVFVEGQLETRKWQDQSGADRYSTEVVLRPFNSTLILLDGAKPDDRSGYEPRQHTPTGRVSEQRQAPANGFGNEPLDDDVPF